MPVSTDVNSLPGRRFYILLGSSQGEERMAEGRDDRGALKRVRAPGPPKHTKHSELEARFYKTFLDMRERQEDYAPT